MGNNKLFYISENFCFDQSNRCLTDANRNPKYKLTKMQYGVLNYLIKHRNVTLDYDWITREVWDDTGDSCQHSLANIISQLRKIDDSLKECINTHNGIGISFECKYPQPTQADSNEIQIASAGELERFGHTPLSAAKALVANDLDMYGPLGEKENGGAPALWASFMHAYPETFYCAFNDDNEIVGN